ncbi:unnamed protein product [Caenorhabditis brenneri]
MSPITVALTPKYNEIWQNCHNLGHEMIVTTKIRKIFPTLEFQISGLDEKKSYKLSMHLERADNKKYRFDNFTLSCTSSISNEPMDPSKIVFHPRGPQTGEDWMACSISFDNIRITCTKQVEKESELFVHLLSGHRYQPVLMIYEEDKPVFVSKIEHMTFIATTLYHNDGIRVYKRSMMLQGMAPCPNPMDWNPVVLPHLEPNEAQVEDVDVDIFNLPELETDETEEEDVDIVN